MGRARTGEAVSNWLAAHQRWRLGVRSVAERIRSPGKQGNLANKATWLYYYGVNPPFELRWDRPKGSHQIGFYDQRGRAANKPTLGKREANATPLEFRDELLRLAARDFCEAAKREAGC